MERQPSLADPRLKKANCIGEDPELFFPIGNKSSRALEQAEKAKKICAQCIVREVCGIVAVEKNARDGIWGGQTEEEREEQRLEALREARELAQSSQDTEVERAS